MNTNYLPEIIVVKSLHLRFWVENLLISMMTKLDQLLKIMLKSSAVHTLITKIKKKILECMGHENIF